MTDETENASSETPSAEEREQVETMRKITAVLRDLGTFVRKLGMTDMKPKIVTLSIDGLKYTSAKLPASTGLEVWPRLTALLGVTFTRSIATGSLQGATPDVFVRIADRAMRDGLAPLVTDLLARMQVNRLAGLAKDGPVMDDFDEHFAGEYLHLVKVCVFAIAHNLRGPTLGGG